jgi:O-antigen/teichoic acid export membrane protein
MTVIATSYLMSFLLSAFLGRMLGPVDLGAWSATAAVSSIILGFTMLGIDSPVARRMAIEPAHAAKWLGHGIGIRLFISLPLSIILIVTATHFFYQGVVPLIFAVGYALYAALGGIAGLITRGCQILNYFSWQYIPLFLGTFPALIAVYVWVDNGGGLLGVVFCTAVGQIMGIIGLTIVMYRTANPSPRYDRKAWGSLLRESWPLAVSTPFLAAYSRIDSVLLLNLRGPESAGYYSSAYGFFMAFCGLASGVQAAIFPALAKTYAESPASAYRLFKQSLRWMFLLAVFGVVGTMAVGEQVLVLVYGESFRVATDTLYILMSSSVFLLLNNTYGMTLNAIGRQREAMYITIGGLLTNIIANLVLIPEYDFEGSAWATLVTEFVVLLMLHLSIVPKWLKLISRYK